MDIDATALKEEVGRLCRRGAARDAQLRQHLGDNLRRLANISESDLTGQIPIRLSSLVERCLGDHAEERETLLTALGLHPPAQHATLNGRLVWLANKRYVAPRTMRRRLEDAIDAFVHAAVALACASATADELGYIVDMFDGTVTFDGCRTRCIERRRVRVVRDQLSVIRCRFGVPSPRRGGDEFGFNVDLVYGGVRCDVGYQTSVVEYGVEVPRPLDAGDLHEFEITYELPAAQPMDPYYVVRPAAPFGSVSLTVRFDPRRVPERVWQINGVLRREIDGCPPDDQLLSLEPTGCVRATFHDGYEGRMYGIAWG
jgi:hypothetical protein